MCDFGFHRNEEKQNLCSMIYWRILLEKRRIVWITGNKVLLQWDYYLEICFYYYYYVHCGSSYKINFMNQIDCLLCCPQFYERDHD